MGIEFNNMYMYTLQSNDDQVVILNNKDDMHDAKIDRRIRRLEVDKRLSVNIAKTQYLCIGRKVCCEVLVVLWNRKKLKNLVEKLEREPFAPNVERGGEIEEKLIQGCRTFTTTQAIICWGSVVVTVGMSTVVTFYKRVTSSDYRNWEFTYGPLTMLNVSYSPNYEITWLYQIACVTFIGFNHCSIILIMAGILAHASVQFKILQNNLERISKNAYTFMIKDGQRIEDEDDAAKISWKYLKQSLDNTISYHLDILAITTELEEIFNMLTLTIFVFSLGVMCFLVYHTTLLPLNSIMRLFKAFTDCMSALAPVFLLCYWSHQVAHESFEVSKAAYRANFVGSDLKLQKSLALIITRSQRPVVLKAGKFFEISLPTFVWILRTSYSAFMVLKNVNDK
ncbi:hypothetical protein FQA39_LY03702 [Lamprigera yunnana]|nr:hypothetical protein FQA39_LY03702 [Lamprigera yunnana]